MADTKAETTIAEELKTASAELRAVGGSAMAGPWESLNNGDRLVAWRNVPGTDFDDDFEYVVDEPLEKKTAEWIALVNPLLAEPLAVWLDEFADWAARSVEPREWDEDDKVMVHESEYCDGEIGKNCRCFDRALAVARVINGTTPQEASAHA